MRFQYEVYQDALRSYKWSQDVYVSISETLITAYIIIYEKKCDPAMNLYGCVVGLQNYFEEELCVDKLLRAMYVLRIYPTYVGFPRELDDLCYDLLLKHCPEQREKLERRFVGRVIKEELVAKVFHPDRVERMGGMDWMDTLD